MSFYEIYSNKFFLVIIQFLLRSKFASDLDKKIAQVVHLAPQALTSETSNYQLYETTWKSDLKASKLILHFKLRKTTYTLHQCGPIFPFANFKLISAKL